MPARLPQLQMARASLEGIPEVETPAGYRLRTYRPGDEAAWCRLVNEGIGGDYTEEKCREELIRRPSFDPADLFFAERGGEVVGTACALRQEEGKPGIVHMVAVSPEHRGHGLGRALVAAVLHRLRELGYAAAELSTDDFRLPAIATYLSLGFQPKFTHESHEERWRAVRERLQGGSRRGGGRQPSARA